MEEGWEPTQTPSRTSKSSTIGTDNLERSLRRTKRTVKQLSSYNDFNQWVTLTIADDRQDDTKSLHKLHRWLHNQKRKHGPFRYLLVPERHKTGELHFHGIFGGYEGTITPATNNKASSRYYGQRLIQNNREVFNLTEFDLGFSKLEIIESPQRISTYITKYITKDLPQIGKNKKRYWASKGLALPPTENNPQWFENAKPKHTSCIKLTHGNLWFFPSELPGLNT